MIYTPKIDPKRGFMIEKMQPITTLDVALVRRILEENDEVVIGIGDAGASHEPGSIMTAGERIDLVDKVLQAEGIMPGRYMIVPIENVNEASHWIAETRILPPPSQT